MTKSLKTLIVLGALTLLVIIFKPFFILPEGEQVVVTRFGRITNVHDQAGLKLKVPLVDQVTRYSKKILSWDGDAPQRLPTVESQFILVDTTARWRIVDLSLFYQRLKTMDKAYARLDNIIESAVRTVVSQYSLAESVRSSNIVLESESAILDFEKQNGLEDIEEGDESGTMGVTGFAPIAMGREKLSDEMLRRSQASMPQYGIELLDVVIRQIRYSDDLTQSVYDRMISERRRIASGYRSDGEGKKAEWLGRLNREKEVIQSGAQAEAATIRAEGDAGAARIYADAYGNDPDFYAFWRALNSYQLTMPELRKVLSTDMDYFRYLYSVGGR